jgi:hypothetical protein
MPSAESMNSSDNAARTAPSLPDPHVQQVLRAACEELHLLLERRTEIMKRIGSIKQTMTGLANMFGEDILGDDTLDLLDRRSGGRRSGLTRTCRVVLMEACRPMGMREVCDHIEAKIPTLLASHKDPKSSVTTVLSRLVAYGEAVSTIDLDGHRVWKWVAEPKVSHQEQHWIE